MIRDDNADSWDIVVCGLNVMNGWTCDGDRFGYEVGGMGTDSVRCDFGGNL